MKLPDDTSVIRFMMTAAPEPVRDFDTKAPKKDESGEVLFSYPLVALLDGGAELIAVKMAGAPAVDLKQGTSVKVMGLVASTWSMDNGRSGVSFKAAGIEALKEASPARAS